MILFLIIGLFLGYSLGSHSIVSSSPTYYESIGKVPIPDIEVKEPEVTIPSNPVLPKIIYKDDPRLDSIIKEKKYTPFIDLGISTSSTLSFGGGLIDNSSSLGIRYNYQITKNGSEHFIGAIKTF